MIYRDRWLFVPAKLNLAWLAKLNLRCPPNFKVISYHFLSMSLILIQLSPSPSLLLPLSHTISQGMASSCFILNHLSARWA